MKQLCCFIAGLMAVYALYAQDKVDDFGKINKAELENKTCAFDPDADAVCLYDLGEVFYNFTARTIDLNASFRKRIKILKDNGVSQADIKIRYYSKDHYESISNITGVVYNLDDAGNVVVTKLDKDLIYNKKIDSRYSEISFALPNVKAGSVIEYKYKSYKENNIDDIEDWYFQSAIPVQYSAYNLVIPKYFDFTYKVVRRQPMEMFRSKSDNGGQWFVMHDVPGLKNEPYISGLRNYLQRVDFQLSTVNPPGGFPINFRTTWQKLSEELMEAEWFGKQLNKNVPGSGAPLKLLLADVKTDQQKMDVIYRFVQSNMSWNGDRSRGSYEGIKDAWDKKTGSTGDINLLLINLLKDNGLSAFPMLISTRDNGQVNTMYPFLNQFNGVYAFVNIDGRNFVLNAADKYNPSTLYPSDVQLTDAFVVKKNNNSFFLWVNDPAKKYRHNISYFMMIDKDGNVNGNGTINSFEYAKNVRIKTYRDGNLKQFLSQNEGIELTMDSVTVSHDEIDSLPFEQKMYYKGVLQNSGDYTFLPYNLFSGLEKNPFVADKRTADIDFGYNQSYIITGGFNVDEAYDIDELPKNIRMILPDSSISLTRIIQRSGNIINFRVAIDFLRPQYSAEDYLDIKEVYKKIYAILNEHIVLQKKKA